ncbi:MAG: serine hydrolase [Bacteroidia bacterium]|nr:serine hydrolase [Bacteroidia bacterium]
MRYLTILFFWLVFFHAKSQTLYFPPVTGTAWDTISPASLGWCQPEMDSLLSYLESRNSKAFILLKDGKIVIEHYFGTFTTDSLWYWASAGKSLTASLIGIAEAEGLLNIQDPVSQYLGNGWTSETTIQEDSITIRHLLTMTSGMDDSPPLPCTNEDTAASCLLYHSPAGTRWAYHSGAYRKLLDVVASASGTDINTFTSTRLANSTGIAGFWYDGVFYSKARMLARFGLLALNRGIWDTTPVINDSVYFHDMVNTSQPYNSSYGYLWWLNGKSSYMVPGLQIVFNGSLIPNAPADMVAAMGKNGQLIDVVPSMNLVFVRIGDNPGGALNLVSPAFNDTIWQLLNNVFCTSGIAPESTGYLQGHIYPNPFRETIHVDMPLKNFNVVLTDFTGRLVYKENFHQKNIYIDTGNLASGMYFLHVFVGSHKYTFKLIRR